MVSSKLLGFSRHGPFTMGFSVFSLTTPASWAPLSYCISVLASNVFPAVQQIPFLLPWLSYLPNIIIYVLGTQRALCLNFEIPNF